MAGSHHISRRDFIKAGHRWSSGGHRRRDRRPRHCFLIDPALRPAAREAWGAAGPLENFEIGTPTLVTFVRTKVNGWEKTSNSYGGLRSAQDRIRVERAFPTAAPTWLGAVELEGDQQAYVCPCHDATFSLDGSVLGGPPPRPLDQYAGNALKIEEGVRQHPVHGRVAPMLKKL